MENGGTAEGGTAAGGTAAGGTAAGGAYDGGWPSPDWFDAVLHWTSLAIEAAGVLAVIAGAVAASLLFAKAVSTGGDWSEAYHLFRTRLARSILLGLEFLVAADIIGTVAVEPTLDNLAVLGLIVLIRTFLSFSLEIEVEGRLPWQKAQARGGGGGERADRR